jgi:hypothetical protein
MLPGKGSLPSTTGTADHVKFVIEREMPGVGKLSPANLKSASQTSCNVLRDLRPEVQWVHAQVTDD